jgi:hypothetical protein
MKYSEKEARECPRKPVAVSYPDNELPVPDALLFRKFNVPSDVFGNNWLAPFAPDTEHKYPERAVAAAEQ